METPKRPTIAHIDLSTPHIKQLTSDELRTCLRDALNLLRAKDEDLKLAAEIGQSLLHANEQLKKEYDEINQLMGHRKPVLNDGNDDTHILSLENYNTVMQQEVDKLSSELDEIKTSSEKTINFLERELKESRLEANQLQIKVETLVKANQSLQQERNQLLSRAKRSKHKNDVDSSQVEVRISELEDVVMEMVSEKQKMENTIAALKEELSLTQTRYEETREELENLSDLKLEYELKSAELQSCQASLDECRARLLQLSDSSPVEPNDRQEPQNKDLFSEVDDKRVELQTQHQQLESKHKDLIKAHVSSIYQQERMKNHITRLSQLKNRIENDSVLQRLEQTVLQLQNENKNLLMKLNIVEKQKKRRDSILPTTAATCNVANDDDLYEIYKMQLKQMEREKEKLEREIKSVNLLKAQEIEKRVTCESLIAKRETENDLLRNRLSQIQFELDDLKLKMKMNKIEEKVEDLIKNEDDCNDDEIENKVETILPQKEEAIRHKKKVQVLQEQEKCNQQ